MGRPQKHTVDYFSHDADASEGRTISIIENRFGADGYMAWFKLLERLSRAENHVIECRNGEDTEYLSSKLHVQPEKLRLILEKLAELGAIDKDLFLAGYIWSQNFVDRLGNVYDNRKQPLPAKPVVSMDNNAISTPEKSITIPDSTHSIVKYSIVKYSKVNNTDFVLPEWIDKELWLSFVEMRKKIKKPLTDTAIELIIRKLTKLRDAGDNPTEVINQSIMNSWAGIFPVKDDQKAGNNGKHRGHSQEITTTGIPGNRPAGAFDGITGD